MRATPLSAQGLLQLMWLASPALPVGGFSYSEGLEAAIEAGCVSDEESAAGWILDQLELGLARGDLAALSQAMAAWRASDATRLRELDAWVLSSRESAEFTLQTRQMGRSFLEWLKLHHDDAASIFDGLAPSYPLAYAFAASRTDASPRDACLSFAFGWAENMVAAAIKAIPLGQSAGQRVLGRLARAIPQAVSQAMVRSDDDRQSFCPMLAILSSQHETQYSRLFRS